MENTSDPLFSRRDLLELALVSPLVSVFPQRRDTAGTPLNRQALINAPGMVIGLDGARVEGVQLVRDWSGPFCRAHVVSRRRDVVRVKEIALFEITLGLPGSTALYGEGFQMLTQTGGTLAQPVAYSQYTDAGHYKIPANDGARAFYGLVALTPPREDTRVLAFTSCARFAGRFELRDSSLRAVLEAEGLEIRPGETWLLEELMFASGPNRAGRTT